MTKASESTSVLIAGYDQYSVLAAVRALRAAGYVPWFAVSGPGPYAGRSRATAGTVPISDPAVDGEGLVREVAAAAVRLSVAVVLPSAEAHLVTLAAREADFPGTTLGVPSRESVERATDKAQLTKLAAAAGLQTPPTKSIVRGDRKTIGTFGFPAIVKPRRSIMLSPNGNVLRYPTRYVSAEQAEEVHDALADGEGLVQPYIPGALVSVAGISWEGELVCAMHQASIRIWPVPVGVSSYAETVPPNMELEQGVSCLLQSIGWSGIFQAQFIRSPNGEHYLIDLNPRIYGSLMLAIAAGLNLPGIWVDLLLGRRPDVGGYRVGVRFRQEEKDVRALARLLVKGRWSRRELQGLVPRRNTTHAVFSLRDPLPLLSSTVNLSQWLSRRLAPKRTDGRMT
jgi:predicted ATP-grasp superfamily ATP-dependent carboligase